MAGSINTESKILFTAYDTGTTGALLPAMDELLREGVPFQVMAVGTAHDLMKDHFTASGHSNVLLDMNSDCGVETVIPQNGWDRARELPKADLAKIAACAAPKVVVSGMSSAVEDQIGETFFERGAKHLVDYDGFADFDKNNPVGMRFLDSAFEFLVPTQKFADSLVAAKSDAHYKVVGQPSLEEWSTAPARIDAASIRAKLNLTTDKPVLLYAGGYGDTYEQAFRLFCEAAKVLQSDYQIIVSIHPKRDDPKADDGVKYFERHILDESGLQNVHVISKKRSEVTTLEATLVADVVASQNSTVGVQALFMHRPTLYLDNPGTDYSNLSIATRVSPQVTTAADFITQVRALDRAADAPGYFDSLPQKLGIPSGATQSLVKEILATVRGL